MCACICLDASECLITLIYTSGISSELFFIRLLTVMPLFFYFVLMRETPRLHFNSQPLSMFAVQFLNAIGDLLDLIPVLKRRSDSSSDSFRMPGMSHCSALIKVRGYDAFTL